jgi:quercetin dioxygenase-like cupin family protein
MDRRDLFLGGIALAAGSAASPPDKYKVGDRLQDNASAPPGSRQTIFQEADGEHLVRRAGPMGGLPFTIKLDGQVGGSSDMFVFTEVLSPGQTIPWHRHDGCEEVMLVEEGGVTITVGMERKKAGPRAIAFMPQGVWHSATNVSDHAVHITSIYSGHDFAYYLRAISVAPGQPVVPINSDDLPRLRALGHATYWDSKLGPFPPGVAHP